MALNRRIGTITEIFSSDRDLIFEWKISNVFPRLGIVGDKYRSPFVTFLYAKFYLTVSVRRGDWSCENINLALSRTLWHSRVQCSLCIRKSVDNEEEIVRGQIVSTFQNGFKVTFRNFQAVPTNPFIVICKMWVDERPLVRGFFNDSEMSRNASSRWSEDANRRTGRRLSMDSQMSRETGSSRAEQNTPPSSYYSSQILGRRLSIDSQMSRETGSSTAQQNIPSSESQSRSSLMSWATTSSVTDERRSLNGRRLSIDSQMSRETGSSRAEQNTPPSSYSSSQILESQSSSSQMSWATTSSVTDERRLSTANAINKKRRRLSMDSQMSRGRGSSRAEENIPPRESQSSISQMSSTTTSSVTDERSLSSDGANSLQTSTSSTHNGLEILNSAVICLRKHPGDYDVQRIANFLATRPTLCVPTLIESNGNLNSGDA